jgi:hypothetical protein
MPRKPLPKTTISVRGQHVTVQERLVQRFPEAEKFIEHLLDNDVSISTAVLYAGEIVKARRDGSLMSPGVLARQQTYTAVRAYWKWIAEQYEPRVNAVIQALCLVAPSIRDRITWLRCGSIVPPLAGKQIPTKVFAMNTLQLPRSKEELATNLHALNEIKWSPSSSWTLHIPTKEGTPAHTDPCPDCIAIELSAEHVQVIATGFYDAWGATAKLENMPGDCLLFGNPPLADLNAVASNVVEAIGAIQALVDRGQFMTTLENFKATVTESPFDFIERLHKNRTDVIVMKITAVTTEREAFLKEFIQLVERYRVTEKHEDGNGATNGLHLTEA